MSSNSYLSETIAQREAFIVDLINKIKELQKELESLKSHVTYCELVIETKSKALHSICVRNECLIQNNKKAAANAVIHYENYLSSFPVTAQEFADLILAEEIKID